MNYLERASEVGGGAGPREQMLHTYIPLSIAVELKTQHFAAKFVQISVLRIKA